MAPTITPTDSTSDFAAFALLDITEPRFGAGSLDVRDRLLRGALMLERQIQISFDGAAGAYELGTTDAH